MRKRGQDDTFCVNCKKTFDKGPSRLSATRAIPLSPPRRSINTPRDAHGDQTERRRGARRPRRPAARRRLKARATLSGWREWAMQLRPPPSPTPPPGRRWTPSGPCGSKPGSLRPAPNLQRGRRPRRSLTRPRSSRPRCSRDGRSSGSTAQGANARTPDLPDTLFRTPMTYRSPCSVTQPTQLLCCRSIHHCW